MTTKDGIDINVLACGHIGERENANFYIRLLYLHLKKSPEIEKDKRTRGGGLKLSIIELICIIKVHRLLLY